MLSKLERQQIRQIIESPQWPAIERVAELTIQKMIEEEVVRDTQWETLKSVLKREGRIQGTRDFIKLFNEARNE